LLAFLVQFFFFSKMFDHLSIKPLSCPCTPSLRLLCTNNILTSNAQNKCLRKALTNPKAHE
jgi:hypothetical protein